VASLPHFTFWYLKRNHAKQTAIVEVMKFVGIIYVIKLDLQELLGL
jgi:hypothetical protein